MPLISLDFEDVLAGTTIDNSEITIEKQKNSSNVLVKKPGAGLPMDSMTLYNGTDATVGIQTAINNLLPGQGVYFYNGSYSVNKPLHIPNDVYLHGEGNDTIFDYSNLGKNHAIIMEKGSRLSDFKLSGSVNPFPYDFSQKILANDSVVIENLVISKMGYGIETAGSNNITLKNIRCEFIQSVNDTGACVHAGLEDGMRTSNMLVDRFTIVDSNRGIELDANSSNVTVQHGNMDRIKNFNSTGRQPLSLAVQPSDGESGANNITFRHIRLLESGSPSTKLASDSDTYARSDLPRNVLYQNITVINPINVWEVNGNGVTIKDIHLINSTKDAFVLYKNSQDIWIQNVTSNGLHKNKYFAYNAMPKHNGIQNVSIIGNRISNSPYKTGPVMSFYDITNLTVKDNLMANVPQRVDAILTRDVRDIASHNNSITYAGDKFYNSTNSMLPESNRTDIGTELKHKDNWIMTNHDIYGTRSSNQTQIGKDNIDKLTVRWILQNEHRIQQPPLIIGDKGYVQDTEGNVMAFGVTTGLNLWNAKVGKKGNVHGLTYDNGIIFAPTGAKSTIVAINATDGRKIWESVELGSNELGFRNVAPPIVWKDYVIAGSAGGEEPPYMVQGNITALNRTNGDIIWSFRTTAGEWVRPEKTPPNGGATTWSGGSLDTETGILYIPAGNPRPEFNATSRQTPNLYANHMLAINITNGNLVWATPFVAHGTVLPVSLPDTHDWDTSWGSSVTKVRLDNGTEKKMVIGHDKRGDIIAMDAATGNEIWWKNVATLYRDNTKPRSNGSGEVWPGSQYGIEAYHAVDNDTLYVAVSNMGVNYFLNGTEGYVVPLFDAIENGIGNGSITAIDLNSGDVKWEYKTEFPTWVSPLVTNGVVFSGHITDTGKPYTYNRFGVPQETPLKPSGIILALDKETGQKLWQFNVGAPIGIGGPSVGHGMLFVTTTLHAELRSIDSGSVVAFGLD